MKSILFVINVFLFTTIFAQDNFFCEYSEPFCIGTTFTSETGGISQSGNNYGCLLSQPNPSWYFLKIEDSGQIDLSLSAPSDIDFVIYGPFNSLNATFNTCGTLGDINSPVVDCSYSATMNETPSIPNGITGEYYLLLITNYANTVQQIDLVQTGGNGTLDCDIYGESSYHYIGGNMFYDNNQNGINDGTDVLLPYVNFSITPNNYSGISNSNGTFSFTNYSLNDVDYVIYSELDGWSSTTTNQYQFTLDTLGSIMSSANFGFYPDSIYTNANIDLINNPTKCIGNTKYWVNVSNTGTENLINFDFSIDIPTGFELFSSQIPYNSLTNNTISYSVNSLSIFETMSFYFILTPLTSNTLAIGDTINISALLNFTDSNGPITVTDSMESIVSCSYDPNIKISLPNGQLASDTIGVNDSLEYIIHFQNTGTAPAVNINILDTISEHLEIESFTLLSSSHDVLYELDTNRTINFRFNNINLPDSTFNEPMSHGYVRYFIKLKDSLSPNTVINNSASIYFDFNEPIITNTTNNIIDCYLTPEPAIFSVQNNTLYVNNTDSSYTYQWYQNGSIQQGNESDSIIYTQNGTYTVQILNQFNCSSFSDSILCPIPINLSPSINNNLINSNLSATSYDFLWLLNSDTLIMETGNQLAMLTNGQYQLIVNMNGCIDSSTYLNCSFIDPTQIFNTNDTLQSGLQSNFYHFTWLFEGDTLQGENENFIIPASNGTYELLSTNLYGCSDYHSVYKNCSFMEDPDFDFENNILSSNLNQATYSFVWLFEGDTLLNQESSDIVVNNNGTYTIISTDVYGCTLSSDYLSSLSIDEQILEYKIYPNPSRNNFIIESLNNDIKTIEILDNLGNLVYFNDSIKSNQTILNLESLESGIYILQINNSIIKKIIKL